MLALSTGRYTILRGVETEDEYGDITSDNAPVANNVLGSIMEKGRTDFNPVSGRVATVRVLRGRFSHSQDIRDGDRLLDEKTGITFLVNSVAHSTSVLGKADIVLELSNVD